MRSDQSPGLSAALENWETGRTAAQLGAASSCFALCARSDARPRLEPDIHSHELFDRALDVRRVSRTFRDRDPELAERWENSAIRANLERFDDRSPGTRLLDLPAARSRW